MKKIKILISIGTRPEAIKMAPVYLEMKKNRYFDTRLLVTAQHRGLLDDMLSLFCIRAHYDLNIMKEDQSLFEVNRAILAGMEKVLKICRPDILLVHGDTLTTMVSSLSAFYLKIPVAHVEAGLRTYDLQNPFPEELDRRVTDIISSLLFAPTEHARRNLLSEKADRKKVFVTGNTVIDSLKMMGHLKPGKSRIISLLAEKKRIILMTIHRRENFGGPVREIFTAVRDCARKNAGYLFIYPVHPNPNVGNAAREILSGIGNIKLIPPVHYLDFIRLMHKCYFILTDSGGIQEEAPAFSRPVIVARTETERPEAIEAGTAVLGGNSYLGIKRRLIELMSDTKLYNRMSGAGNPFGDGRASKRIAYRLARYFGIKSRKIDEFKYH